MRSYHTILATTESVFQRLLFEIFVPCALVSWIRTCSCKGYIRSALYIFNPTPTLVQTCSNLFRSRPSVCSRWLRFVGGNWKCNGKLSGVKELLGVGGPRCVGSSCRIKRSLSLLQKDIKETWARIQGHIMFDMLLWQVKTLQLFNQVALFWVAMWSVRGLLSQEGHLCARMIVGV